MSKNTAKQLYTQTMEWLPIVGIQRKKHVKTQTRTRFNKPNR